MWLTFSKDSQTFSQDLFNNYFGLERYMSGEKELKAIEGLSKKPDQLRRPTKIDPYFGRWSILWICVKFPVNLMISSTCSAVAFLLNTIWLKQYAALFEVASTQMTRQWQQVSDQWVNHQSPLLVPSLNAPKMGAWDVYTCSHVPTSSVDDPDVKPLTPKEAVLHEQMDLALDTFYVDLDKGHASQWFITRWPRNFMNWLFARKMERSAFKASYKANPSAAMKQLREAHRFSPIERPIATLYKTLLEVHQGVQRFSHLQLCNSRGDCRGASMWFINLLLKSDHFFSDPVKHIMAVAKQFETGISGQGLILQALVNCSNLLKLNKVEMKEHTVSTFELDADHTSSLRKIQNLPSGIYRVGVYGHSLVHIKLPNGESYTWDPSFGLYEQNANEFLQFVLDRHYVKENPKSQIYFEQYRSMEPTRQTA